MDVNVILSGTVGRAGTVNWRIYEAFLKGELRAVISEPLLFELEKVLGYERMRALGVTPSVAARLMRDLLLLGEYVAPVPQLDWDSLSDVKDWYLFDLLFEARANALVTQDLKVQRAGAALQMSVFSPIQLCQAHRI
jgi:putative PIN family toxin of toxin-antitoxin system